MKREIKEFDNIIKDKPVMVKIDDLSTSIKSDILEWCDNNPDWIPEDGYIKLSAAISHFLNWNGIVGYTNEIVSIIETAKECDINVKSIL